MDDLIDELYQSSVKNERVLARHLEALINSLHQAEDRNYSWKLDKTVPKLVMVVVRKYDGVGVATEYTVYGESDKLTTWRII